MKTPSFSLIILFVCLAACKKNEESPEGNNPTSNTGKSFMITAPTCLVSTYEHYADVARYFYDSQKRISRITYDNNSEIITYTYETNRILELHHFSSGYEQELIHYLNPMGLIDSTLNENTTTVYSYNDEGYLLSELNYLYHNIIPSGGLCYQYKDGNCVAQGGLYYNHQTGQLDTSINSTFGYYTDIPGKLDEWRAWTTRTGRGNRNAIKSYGNYTYTYQNDQRGWPNVMAISDGVVSDSLKYTWICY